MDLKMIERKIEGAVQHEAASHTLRQLMKRFANDRGLNPTRSELEGAVQFVREYVEHVPYYLKLGRELAKKQGISQMEAILERVAQYWRLDSDLIPDHLGLLGVMDDAYCSLATLQAVSDRCVQGGGAPILPDDLHAVNQSVRGLIGEPIASQLDAYVMQAIGLPDLNQLLAAAMQWGAGAGPLLGGMGPDPMWGNATPTEIANARLGAMGVI